MRTLRFGCSFIARRAPSYRSVPGEGNRRALFARRIVTPCSYTPGQKGRTADIECAGTECRGCATSPLDSTFVGNRSRGLLSSTGGTRQTATIAAAEQEMEKMGARNILFGTIA